MENRRAIQMINTVYKESKGRYGSPKITEELRLRGLQLSRPRVARLMRSEGIKSIVHKKFRVVTTDSKHNYPVAENHLNRNFKVDAPGKVWVSDITYIGTAQGWLYLTIIMDLFDRKIIGWALSKRLTAKDTVVAAWKMALINRPLRGRLIFHSDRGVQYACCELRQQLKGKPVIQSMSRKGDCWDNAVAENFFKILKSELVRHSRFIGHQQAQREVFEFIEIWYNRKRKHAYLGYLTPEEFRNNYFLNAAA
ncbi:MAG: transposase [Chitinophagales bacterium]|nr:MAG: transposase [Chitinophagales bacterium]